MVVRLELGSVQASDPLLSVEQRGVGSPGAAERGLREVGVGRQLGSR